MQSHARPPSPPAKNPFLPPSALLLFASLLSLSRTIRCQNGLCIVVDGSGACFGSWEKKSFGTGPRPPNGRHAKAKAVDDATLTNHQTVKKNQDCYTLSSLSLSAWIFPPRRRFGEFIAPSGFAIPSFLKSWIFLFFRVEQKSHMRPRFGGGVGRRRRGRIGGRRLTRREREMAFIPGLAVCVCNVRAAVSSAALSGWCICVRVLIRATVAGLRRMSVLCVYLDQTDFSLFLFCPPVIKYDDVNRPS